MASEKGLPLGPAVEIPRKLRPNAKYEPGVSMTKQSEKDSADVNQIMAKYQKTGQLPTPNPRQPFFGDVSRVGSYQSGLNAIHEAQDAFDALPSTVRKRFSNDPLEMIKFLSNKDNKDEAIKLGLIDKPKPEPVPVKVEVTNPPKV